MVRARLKMMMRPLSLAINDPRRIAMRESIVNATPHHGCRSLLAVRMAIEFLPNLENTETTTSANG
jgi:hypothetical protein